MTKSEFIKACIKLSCEEKRFMFILLTDESNLGTIDPKVSEDVKRRLKEIALVQVGFLERNKCGEEVFILSPLGFAYRIRQDLYKKLYGEG